MIVGVPKELYPGERRVALTPVVVPMLAKAGLEVAIEAGAGVEAGYPDAQYQEKGAKILADRAAVFAQSDIIVQVLCNGANDKNGASDLALMGRGQVLIGFMRPLAAAEAVQEIARTGVTAFAVGDEVLGFAPRAAQAEYVAVNVDRVTAKPAAPNMICLRVMLTSVKYSLKFEGVAVRCHARKPAG